MDATPPVTHHTYRLFARPSFLEGFARILDVGGTLNSYLVTPSGAQADYDAILSDWMAVGADMSHAITSYERESA